MADSNSQAQRLSQFLKDLDRRIDACVRPNLDKESVTPTQLYDSLKVSRKIREILIVDIRYQQNTRGFMRTFDFFIAGYSWIIRVLVETVHVALR